MNLKRTLLVGAACMALAASATAQVTKSGNGYLFRTKLTPGATAAYSTTTSAKMPGGRAGMSNMNVVMSFSQKIMSVRNGVADVRVTVQPAKMNGQTQPGQKAQTVNVKMDNRGKIVGGMAQNPSGGLAFPAGPVPVGGTWRAKVPMSAPGMAGGSLDATYRFVRVTKVNGRPAAEIAVKMTGTSPMRINGSGKTYIAMSDGSLISSTVAMTMNMSAAQTGGRPMNIAMNVSVRRTR